MKRLIMEDVGDGMNLLIQNSDHFDLFIDFGGNKNIDYRCFCAQDDFLLTHFHTDHYNGILNCYKYMLKCWNIRNFYHPVMPKFSDSNTFFKYLLAMNIRISKNHPIQNFIFKTASKINNKPIKFIPVGMGDEIVCGNKKYNILWPPRELKEKETLKVIKDAINHFEIAKEKDKILNDIYESIEQLSFDNFDDNILEDSLPTLEKNLVENKEVEMANKSLKKAANRLSIAFSQGENLLFLGDLEKKEINLVVNKLCNNNSNWFDIIISAHHGTHWGNELINLKTEIVLASVGITLKKHLSNNYKTISKKFINTHDWGNIKIVRKTKVK